MITVKSSGSAEPALNFVAAAFQKATGHEVRIFYSADIDDFDVVVGSRDAIERKFLAAGRVEEGAVCLGSMALGVVVRSSAAVPDISSLEALKQLMLESDVILITKNHTSGMYIESAIKKIGIYDQVKTKIEHSPNGPLLMDRLLAGTRKEIGFLSINAIRTYIDKGLTLVGPLPAEMQYVRDFLVATSTTSKNKDVAREFVRFCGGPGKPFLIANGFM
jgi:molybdate transport system substrate-binding protein